MPINWEKCAERSDGVYEVDDFMRALYQLNAEQCLYASHNMQTTAYRLISLYRREFEEAAMLSGNELRFNDRYQYCYVVNNVARLNKMLIEETNFVFTLRYAYHLRAKEGDMNELGEVVIDIPDFGELHKAITGRDLDMGKKSMDDLMSFASRSGLARKEKLEEDPQPFAIVILPGIADVLGEQVINRFGAELKARIVAAKADAVVQETNQETTDEAAL